MKFLFRWAFRLFLLAVVLAVGLLLLKDTLIKEAARQRIQKETGLQVRIGKMEMGLFTPTISIQDLVLYNTAEYGGSPLADVPDLHLEYNYDQLAFQKLHLKLLRLNIRELNIVENQHGKTNLVELLDKVAPETLGKGKASKSSGEFTFKGVDMLNLSVNKVRYTSLKNPRLNHEVHVGMQNSLIQNIRTEEDLAAVILKVLLRAGITIYAEAPVKNDSRTAVIRRK